MKSKNQELQMFLDDLQAGNDRAKERIAEIIRNKESEYMFDELGIEVIK
ncbi:MAG: hypothetical protein KKF56_05670 [Nanoarchaeota archaeon]|nr:hypothetical protein [Nanoarchaeota archaeon]